MKKGLIFSISIVIFILAVILLGYILNKNNEKSDNKTISMSGIHWHPELEIFIKGEKFEIPQNIGLGAVHNPMHTHEDLPLIHLEFEGKVTENDTKLGKFFEVWGKNFNEFGSSVKMTVNDVDNIEYQNYKMKDEDKIILNYE